MIVTIDGPAGAGKSCAAKALSERLRFRFLDTGAMYRAIAWAARQHAIPCNEPALLEEFALGLDIEMRDDRIILNGDDITDSIRNSEVTALVKPIADHAGIRRHLISLQRQMAAKGDVVTEGRDQGTIAFPEAECKIYLTASAEERARRRHADLLAKGEDISLEEVLRRQNARDARDQEREFGRLEPAADAIHVTTDGLSPQEVVEKIEALVRERMD